MSLRVIVAHTDAEFAAARELIMEYAAAPEVAVCVQNLAPELANLPTLYSAPRGAWHYWK